MSTPATASAVPASAAPASVAPAAVRAGSSIGAGVPIVGGAFVGAVLLAFIYKMFFGQSATSLIVDAPAAEAPPPLPAEPITLTKPEEIKTENLIKQAIVVQENEWPTNKHVPKEACPFSGLKSLQEVK